MAKSNPFVVPGRQPGPDAKIVERALRLLVDRNAGFQLTCAPSWAWKTFPGTEAGIRAAAAWVIEMAEATSATAFYFALNPVSPGLAKRNTCGDHLRRIWLLIDTDRVKTNENKHLSATREEHENALALAEEIREDLRAKGWGEPALHLDSGNGAHLLYAIDLPNAPEAQRLLKRVLAALARRFDGPLGTIDTAVHDARRISKLPGTWARKGPNTPERPHRMARILDCQEVEDRVVVPIKVLERTAASEPEERQEKAAAATAAASRAKGNPFVVWAVSDSAEENWVAAVLRGECAKMASAKPGDLNNQLYRSAAALGNVIHLGYLSREAAEEELYAAAKAAGCDNPKKDRGTIRRGFDQGATTPREPSPRPDRGGEPRKTEPVMAAPGKGFRRHPVAQEAIAKALATSGNPRQPRPQRLTDIMRTDYPQPRYAVNGIVSQGLNLLVGKPKLGKSWFALNIAITVAAGGVALGNIPVTQGPVLYMALEDRFPRLKERSTMVLAGLNVAIPDCLEAETEWPRMDNGGLDYLCWWLDGKGWIEERGQKISQCRLVVVDVWAKFRPLVQNSRAAAYDIDYAHMSAFKYVLDHYGTSALVLHHTRKAAAADALDEVSGTAGIGGAADGVLVLSRARAQSTPEIEAELLITGRDHEERQLALTVDPKTWTWTACGSAAERTLGRLMAAVFDVFTRNPTACFTADDVIASLRIEPAPGKQSVRSYLSRLFQEDKLERVSSGRYRFRTQKEESAF